MNVLRSVLLPVACGFAMTATAAPVSSLDQLSGRLLDAGQTADAPSAIVSADAQVVAATIAGLAAPSAGASKTTVISKGSTTQAVPEPESIALLAIAGAALVASRTRRARKA